MLVLQLCSEIFQNFCISCYLPIMKTIWLILLLNVMFHGFCFSNSYFFTCCNITFPPIFDQKRIFYTFSYRKLLTWFLMRIWALLGILPTAWTVIFHFQCVHACLTTSCNLFNQFQKFKHILSHYNYWWQKTAREYMNKSQKNRHLPLNLL